MTSTLTKQIHFLRTAKPGWQSLNPAFSPMDPDEVARRKQLQPYVEAVLLRDPAQDPDHPKKVWNKEGKGKVYGIVNSELKRLSFDDWAFVRKMVRDQVEAGGLTAAPIISALPDGISDEDVQAVTSAVDSLGNHPSYEQAIKILTTPLPTDSGQ
jgi:hypothetical protein